eukprot:TRINITY_DN50767_c0_g1_i1.p1 TRINITY_DN50767_c0_g1~~TRINITY_DN50767_c0_g1_i1.p1  ORF type:complete len:137 (+),score=20.26 TRINITY_DN50767_c0_g1_i1:46-411(+)
MESSATRAEQHGSSSSSNSTGERHSEHTTISPYEMLARTAELLEPTPERHGLRRGALMGDDLFLSWGGLAALSVILCAGGIWRLRRRRRFRPPEPQVLGRLLDEVDGQELVPANGDASLSS